MLKKYFFEHGQKILAIMLLFVLFGQSVFNVNPVASEEKVDGVDLVAILVEAEVFSNRDLATKVSRYAEDVQKALPLTQAVIIPVDKNEHPQNIVKALEGLYLEGEEIEGLPSLLKGVVLVGDVPLPIIRNGDYTFVSMNPYTDFENRAYIWNSEKEIFEENGFATNAEAEVWHGVIRVPKKYSSEQIKYLNAFFDKNHAFHSGDETFSNFNQHVFYADLVNEPEYIDLYFYKGYERFLENMDDISYHRYNKHWAEEITRQGAEALDETYNFDDDGDGKIDEDPLDGVDNDGDGMIDEDQGDLLNDSRADGFDPYPSAASFGEAVFDLNSETYKDLLDNYSQIIIWSFMERYSDLLPSYQGEVVENIQNSGRWSRYDSDTTVSLITEKDEYIYYYLKDVDEALRQEFLKLAKNLDEGYYILDGVATCGKNYCNYYNGKPAGGGTDDLAQGVITNVSKCSLTTGTPAEIGENSVAAEHNRVFYPQTSGNPTQKCDPFGQCCGNNYSNPEVCDPDEALWPVSTDLVRFKEKSFNGDILEGDGTVEIGSSDELLTGRSDQLNFFECEKENLKVCTADDSSGFSTIATIDCNVCHVPHPCPPDPEPQYYYRRISSIAEHAEPTPERLKAQYTDGLSVALPIDEPRYASINIGDAGYNQSGDDMFFTLSKINPKLKELWVWYPELTDIPRTFDIYTETTDDEVYQEILRDLAYLYNRAIVEKNLLRGFSCSGECDYNQLALQKNAALKKYYENLGETEPAWGGGVSANRELWKRGVDEAVKNGMQGLVGPEYFDAILKNKFDTKEIADAVMWHNLSLDEKYQYVLDRYQRPPAERGGRDAYIHQRENGYEIFYLASDGDAESAFYGINPDVPDEIEVDTLTLDDESWFDEGVPDVYSSNPCYQPGGIAVEDYVRQSMLCSFAQAAKLERVIQPVYELGEEIKKDTDYDGVPDEDEERLGFDVNDYDTDRDGIPDGAEGRSSLRIYADQNTLKNFEDDYTKIYAEVLDKTGEVLTTDNWTEIDLNFAGSGGDVLDIVSPHPTNAKNGKAEFRIYSKGKKGSARFVAEGEGMTSNDIEINVADNFIDIAPEVSLSNSRSYISDLTAGGGEANLEIGFYSNSGEIIESGLPTVVLESDPKDAVEIVPNRISPSSGTEKIKMIAGEKAGRFEIKAHATGSGSDNFADADITTLSVLPDKPARIQVESYLEVIPAVPGFSLPIDIYLYDQYNNLATQDYFTLTVEHSGVGNLDFPSGDIDPDSPGLQVPVYAGQATVYLSTDTPGTATLNVTGEGLPQASANFEILPQADIELSISELKPTVGGKIIKGSARVVDSSGKTLTGQVPSIDLRSDDPRKIQVKGDPHILNEDGRIEFELVTGKLSGDVIITATHPGFVPGTLNLNISPGEAKEIKFLNSSDEKLKINKEETLVAKLGVVDKFGNVVETASGQVEFYITPATARFGSISTTRANLENGIAEVIVQAKRESGRIDLRARSSEFKEALPLSIKTGFAWDNDEIRNSRPQDFYSILSGFPAGDVTHDDYLGAYKLFNGKTQAVSTVTIAPEKNLPVFAIDQDGKIETLPSASFAEQRLITNSFKNEPFKIILSESGEEIGEVIYKTDNLKKEIVDSVENLDRGFFLRSGENFSAKKENGSMVLRNSNGFKLLEIDNLGGIDIYDNLLLLEISEELQANGLLLNLTYGGDEAGQILINFGPHGQFKNLTNEDNTLVNGVNYQPYFTRLTTYDIERMPMEYSTALNSNRYYIVNNETIVVTGDSNTLTLEDSPEYEGIGFSEGPKHALLVAAGEPVGKAALPYIGLSEIVLGDPTASLPKHNQPSPLTGFTSGIGEMILTNKEEDVLDLLKLDVDDDGIEDLVVVFEDGEIRYFSEKFVGKNLSRSETLFDVPEDILGAVAGQFTNTDKGFVFLGEKGELIPYIFENRRLTRKVVPDDWEKVHSFFAADMDQDGITDLVVGEFDGDVVIHYGDQNNLFGGETVEIGRVGLLANTAENLTGSVAVYYDGLPKLTTADYLLGIEQTALIAKPGKNPNEFNEIDTVEEAVGTYREYLDPGEAKDLISFYNEYSSDEISIYFEPNTISDSDEQTEYRILNFASELSGSTKNVVNKNGNSEIEIGDTLIYTTKLKNNSGTNLTNLSTAHLGSYYYEILPETVSCVGCGNDYYVRNEDSSEYELIVDGINLPAGQEATLTYEVYVFTQPEILFTAGFYEVDEYADGQLDLIVNPDGNPNVGSLYYFSVGPRQYIEQFITDTLELAKNNPNKIQTESYLDRLAEHKKETKDWEKDLFSFFVPSALANDANKTTITYLGAKWCSACRSSAPTIDRLKSTYGDSVNIVKLDFDTPEGRQFARENGISGFPTTIVKTPNGTESRYVGTLVTSSAFENEVASYANDYKSSQSSASPPSYSPPSPGQPGSPQGPGSTLTDVGDFSGLKGEPGNLDPDYDQSLQELDNLGELDFSNNSSDQYITDWNSVEDIDFGLNNWKGGESGFSLGGDDWSAIKNDTSFGAENDWSYNGIGNNFGSDLGDMDSAYNQTLSDYNNFGDLNLGGSFDSDPQNYSVDGLDFDLGSGGGDFKLDDSFSAYNGGVKNLGYKNFKQEDPSRSFFGGADLDGDGVPTACDGCYNPASTGMTDAEKAADDQHTKSCNSTGCLPEGRSSASTSPGDNAVSTFPGYETYMAQRLGKDPGQPVDWIPRSCDDWKKCSKVRFYESVTKTGQSASAVCTGPYKKYMKWEVAPTKGNCHTSTRLVKTPSFSQCPANAQGSLSCASSSSCSLGSGLTCGGLSSSALSGSLGGMGGLTKNLGGLGGMMGQAGNLQGMLGNLGGIPGIGDKLGQMQNITGNFQKLQGMLGNASQLSSLVQGCGGTQNLLSNLGGLSGVMGNTGNLKSLMQMTGGGNMGVESLMQCGGGISSLVNNVGSIGQLGQLAQGIPSGSGFGSFNNLQSFMNNPGAGKIMGNPDAVKNLSSMLNDSSLSGVLGSGNNLNSLMGCRNLSGILGDNQSFGNFNSLLKGGDTASLLSDSTAFKSLVNNASLKDALGSASKFGNFQSALSSCGSAKDVGSLMSGMGGLGGIGNMMQGGDLGSLISNGFGDMGMQGLDSITGSVGMMNQCGGGTYNVVKQQKKNNLLKGFPPKITQWWHQNSLEIKNVLAEKQPSLFLNTSNYKGNFSCTQKPCQVGGVDDFIKEMDRKPFIDLKVQPIEINVPHLSRMELRKYEERIQELEKRIQEEGLDSGCNLAKSVQANKRALMSLKKFPTELNTYMEDYRKYLGKAQNSMNQVVQYHRDNIERYNKQMEVWHKFGARNKAILKGWQKYVNMALDYNKRSERCSGGRMDSTNWLLDHPDMKLPPLPKLNFKKTPLTKLDVSKIPSKVPFTVPALDIKPQKVILPELDTGSSLNPDATLTSLPTLPKLPEMPELPSLDLPRLPDIPPPPKLPKVFPELMSAGCKTMMVMEKYRMMRFNACSPPEWALKERTEVLSERDRRLLGIDQTNVDFNRRNCPQQYNCSSGMCGISMPSDANSFAPCNMGSCSSVFQKTSNSFGDFKIEPKKYSTCPYSGGCNLNYLPDYNEKLDQELLAYIEKTYDEIDYDSNEYIEYDEIDDEVWIAWAGTTNKKLDAEAAKNSKEAFEYNYAHLEKLENMTRLVQAQETKASQMQNLLAGWQDVSMEIPAALAKNKSDFMLVNQTNNEIQISSLPEEGRYLARIDGYFGSSDANEGLGEGTTIPDEFSDNTPVYPDAPIYNENDMAGFYLFDQSGTAENLTFYSDEMTSNDKVFFFDYDQDADDDIFYSLGGDVYFKENYTIETGDYYVSAVPQIYNLHDLVNPITAINNFEQSDAKVEEIEVTFESVENNVAGYEVALCRTPERCQMVNKIPANSLINFTLDTEKDSFNLSEMYLSVEKGPVWTTPIGKQQQTLRDLETMQIWGGERIELSQTSEAKIFLPDGRIIELKPGSELNTPIFNGNNLDLELEAGKAYIYDSLGKKGVIPGDYLVTGNVAEIKALYPSGSILEIKNGDSYSGVKKPKSLGIVTKVNKALVLDVPRKKAGPNSHIKIESGEIIHAYKNAILRVETSNGENLRLNLKEGDSFNFGESVVVDIEIGNLEVIDLLGEPVLQEAYKGFYLSDGALLQVFSGDAIVKSRSQGMVYLVPGQNFLLQEIDNDEVISEVVKIANGQWYGRIRAFNFKGEVGPWSELIFIDGTNPVSYPYTSTHLVPVGVNTDLSVDLPEDTKIDWDIDLNIDANNDGDTENDWTEEGKSKISVGPYFNEDLKKVRARIVEDGKVTYRDFELKPITAQLEVSLIDINNETLQITSDPALPGGRFNLIKSDGGGDVELITTNSEKGYYIFDESGMAEVDINLNKTWKAFDSNSKAVATFKDPFARPEEFLTNLKLEVRESDDSLAPRFILKDDKNVYAEILYIPAINLDVTLARDPEIIDQCKLGLSSGVCVYSGDFDITLVELGGDNEVAPGGVEVRAGTTILAKITRKGKIILESNSVKIIPKASDEGPLRFALERGGSVVAEVVVSPGPNAHVFRMKDLEDLPLPSESVILGGPNIKDGRDVKEGEELRAGFVNFVSDKVYSYSQPIIINEN